MKRLAIFLEVIFIGVLVAVAWTQRTPGTVYVPLKWAANPGALSKSHAFLKDDCAACHTPNKGVEAANCITCHKPRKSLGCFVNAVEAANCITCHANNKELLAM